MNSTENDKILTEDIFNMNYYRTGKPFSGSKNEMNYRVQKITREIEKENEQENGKEDVFLVHVWKKPFCFEKTKEEKKEKEFPFTEEGKQQVTDWLNEMEKEIK